MQVRIHNDIYAFSRKRVAAWVKTHNSGMIGVLENVWNREHELTLEDKCLVVSSADMHPCWRPTKCWEAHMCICSGDGKVAGLAKTRLQDQLSRLCPKQTKQRKWLMQGCFVLKICAGEIEQWVHIALQYLKPRRSTFILLKATERQYHGRRIVTPEFDEDGALACRRELKVYSDLPLDVPASFTLYKLVEFDERMEPWTPAEKLCVD